MSELTKGTNVVHGVYGRGITSNDSESFVSHQFTGDAVWVCFYKPLTGIAANWPYMVPVSDLKLEQEQVK